MKVIGVDDNGVELLEISAVELDRLCTETWDDGINALAEALRLECMDDPCKVVGVYKILRCASALRSEK